MHNEIHHWRNLVQQRARIINEIGKTHHQSIEISAKTRSKRLSDDVSRAVKRLKEIAVQGTGNQSCKSPSWVRQ